MACCLCADSDRLLAFERGCVSGWVGAVACGGASGGEDAV